MRLVALLCGFVLLAGCSEERKLSAACEKGEAEACSKLATRYSERAAMLCADAAPAADTVCARYRPVPLDLPKRAESGDVQTVLSVVLAADGTTMVDGQAVAGEDAILSLARQARDRNPDVRAVIKADAGVPHGRVIHVLDILKQAQVTKIAFGVSPMPPVAPGSAPSPP